MEDVIPFFLNLIKKPLHSPLSKTYRRDSTNTQCKKGRPVDHPADQGATQSFLNAYQITLLFDKPYKLN